MADNYLERKMEDLRAGRLDRRSARWSSVERVLVLGCDRTQEAVSDIVNRLRGRGRRVAFAGMDRKDGVALACSSGAQYHPVDWISDTVGLEKSLRLIWRAWRGVDRVVIVCGRSEGINENSVSMADGLQGTVADLVERVRRSQPVPDNGITVYETAVA